MMRLFRFFEGLVEPTASPAETTPPPGLASFYWHYARQARWLVVALFCAGFLVAVLDSTIPVFIGRIVGLVASSARDRLWQEEWPQLVGMAAVLIVGRPLALLAQNLITNQAIVPGLTNLIRWQSHWHVVRQSWSFFQNDFAGRIANRVMQTGPALRESVVAATNAVWYITVYGSSAIVLTARADLRLSIPIALWFCFYIVFLRVFVPRLRERSREMSEVRSALTGRVVDSYTNIQTVKLFARPRDEDAVVRESVDEHTLSFHKQQRVITLFGLSLSTLNALMVVGTGGVAVWLWMHGAIGVGVVAMALPLTWQIANMAGWIAQNVTSIFENVGVVQEGMRSIAVPRQMPDRPGAGTLRVDRGGVKFENVHFGYGTERGVLHGVDLTIQPGQRIGLIGPSGAGKSTLVNLLLRFYELEAGRILIDGQDIAT
ncbi:MAG TPA: ABC transporter ATP-binding protein, partial [Dongiaceae bacterium]